MGSEFILSFTFFAAEGEFSSLLLTHQLSAQRTGEDSSGSRSPQVNRHCKARGCGGGKRWPVPLAPRSLKLNEEPLASSPPKSKKEGQGLCSHLFPLRREHNLPSESYGGLAQTQLQAERGGGRHGNHHPAPPGSLL